jgi:uncharacterized membrane protein
MFTKVSKAGLGMYIVVITNVIGYLLGVNLDVNTTTDAVFYILNAIGAVLWLIGQLSRKDLNFGIFRKE